MALSGRGNRGEDAGSAPPSRLLVVDDERAIRDLLVQILSAEGHEVTTAADGAEAMELLGRQPFDLVITDLVMPGLNGVDVLRAAKRIDPDCPVIIITGYPSEETVVSLVRLGASDYIAKPFNVNAVIVAVARLLKTGRRGGEPPSS